MFLLASLFIGGLSIVMALGTFLYDRYLSATLEARAEELAIAQREVNQDQVEEFIRLRDRLVYGQGLLQDHIALSQVFDVLESQTLATVRYESLELTVADDKTARLEIEGTARTFNALAAQSNALAAEKNIRRAIFSGITVNQDATVNFLLTADLDARLLKALPVEAPLPQEAPVQENDLPALPGATPSPAATTTTL